MTSKSMLILLFLLLSAWPVAWSQDYEEDSVQELENLIHRNYAGRARTIALKRLDELLKKNGSEKERKKALEVYRQHLISRLKAEAAKAGAAGDGNLDVDGDGLVGNNDPAPLIASNGGLYWQAHTFQVVVKSGSGEETFRFDGAMTKLLKDKHARLMHPLTLMGYNSTNLHDRIDLFLDPEERMAWNDASKVELKRLRDVLDAADPESLTVTAAMDVSFFNGSVATDYRIEGEAVPVVVNGEPLFNASPVETKTLPANAKYASLVRVVGVVPPKKLLKRVGELGRFGVSIPVTRGGLVIRSGKTREDLVANRKRVEISTRRMTVSTHAGQVAWRVATAAKAKKTTVLQAMVAINKVVRKRKGLDFFVIVDSTLLAIAGMENSVDQEWVAFVAGKKVEMETLLQKPLPDQLDVVLVNKKRIYADFSGHLGTLYVKGDVAYLKKHAPEGIEEWRLGQRAGIPEALFLIAECTMRGMSVAKDIRRGAELHVRAASLGLGASMNRLGEMHRVGMGMEMNDERAFEWFVKAAEKGDPGGLDNLARCYFYGLGVERDGGAAADVFKSAADKGHVFAQYSYGNLLFAKRDFAAALPYFEKSAKGGCAPAMVRLGNVYHLGLGVKPDVKRAFDLWNQAASLNETTAFENLGKAYENGSGVNVDLAKALELYEKSWRSGNRRIGPRLAEMYLNALGTRRDPAKAFEILKAGATRGDGASMVAMAELLLKGDGVPADLEKAETLLLKAGDNGFPDALNRLGDMYEYGRGVKRSPAKAFDYYSIAKDKGSVEAIVRLGWMHESGQGCEPDIEKAFQHYLAAAEKGSVEGARRAALGYLKGRGVTVDHDRAFGMMKKAHDGGDAEATYHLVAMYEGGLGIKKSHAKAIELVAVAAKRGNPTAQDHLGYLYYQGADGYPKDREKAIQWYIKAATGGNVKAMYNVGSMYENGRGVGRDLTVAKEWYAKAAQAGSDPAKEALRRLNAPKAN